MGQRTMEDATWIHTRGQIRGHRVDLRLNVSAECIKPAREIPDSEVAEVVSSEVLSNLESVEYVETAIVSQL